MDLDVSKDFGASMFKVQIPQEEGAAGPLKIKAPRSSETSEIFQLLSVSYYAAV